MAELRTESQCRDIRHAWRPKDGGREGRGYFRVLECRRCGTEVRQTLNLNGEIRRRKYSYPAGYLIKGGRLSSLEIGAIRLIGLNAY